MATKKKRGPGVKDRFKEIKEKVRIEDVLDRYGLLRRLKKREDELLVGSCSIHTGNHHSKKNFCVNRAENSWYCSSCGWSGDVLDFVAVMENVSTKLAALLLQKWFGIIFEEDRNLFKEKS